MCVERVHACGLVCEGVGVGACVYVYECIHACMYARQ